MGQVAHEAEEERLSAPPRYRTVELNRRVEGVEPYLFTRFRWRADRLARRLNRNRLAALPPRFGPDPHTYRWEVCDWLDGRWAVVAMQNQAVPE